MLIVATVGYIAGPASFRGKLIWLLLY
jgi:hypothetical protein